MRLSQKQTWCVFFALSIASFLIAAFFAPRLIEYVTQSEEYFYTLSLQEGSYTTSGLLATSYTPANIQGPILKLENLYKVARIITTPSHPLSSWMKTLLVILIGSTLVGLFIALTLRLVKAVNFHILMWNAPRTKKIVKSCLVPGIAYGIVIGLANYALQRILFGNAYMHNTTTPIFSLPLWLITTLSWIWDNSLANLFGVSLIMWLVTRIKSISRRTALIISILIAPLILSFISLYILYRYSVPTPRIITNFLMILNSIVLRWLISRYTFEASLLANAISEFALIGLSLSL